MVEAVTKNKVSPSYVLYHHTVTLCTKIANNVRIGGQNLETTERFQIPQNVISKQIITKTKSVLDVKIADTSDI